MRSIVPIVEGQGDERAVPVLLRRVLTEIVGRYDIGVSRAIRIGRGKLVKAHELERAVELASIDREDAFAALIIFDADDDDAIALEEELFELIRGTVPLPTRISIAVREYEAWLLGAKVSLRGHQGIRLDATAPANPEGIRSAKAELQANMDRNRKYVETADQVKLTGNMDLAAARAACPSFRRLIENVERLVELVPLE